MPIDGVSKNAAGPFIGPKQSGNASAEMFLFSVGQKMNGYRTVKFDGMRIESSAGRMRSEESSALFYDPIRLKSHTLGSRERARGEMKKV